MRMLVFLACVLSAGMLRAQPAEVLDSLFFLLEQDPNEEYLVLHDLAITYADHDNEKALQYITKAEDLARAANDAAYLMRNQRVKGQILRRLGRSQEALATLAPLLEDPLVAQNPAEYTDILHAVALTYLYQSDFDNALDYFYRTLVSAERLEDSVTLLAVNANLGMVYYKLSDYQKAKTFYLRSYRLRRGSAQSCFSLINLTLSLLQLGELTEGKRYLKEAESACLDRTPVLQLHLDYTRGLYHYKKGDYPSARSHFLSSLALARQHRDRRMELDNLGMLADLAEATGDIQLAGRYLVEGYDILSEGASNNREKLKIYKSLGRLSVMAGNFREAAGYHGQYIALRDSIYSDALITNLMKLEAGFVEAQNRKQIELQNCLLKAQEEMLAGQLLLNRTLAVLAIFVIGFVLLLYRELTRTKRVGTVLEGMVKRRTEALQRKQVELSTAAAEHQLRYARAGEEIRSIARRIQGLCEVAAAEAVQPSVLKCLHSIRDHSEQMVKEVLSHEDSVK